MIETEQQLKGLTDEEVLLSRNKFGTNIIVNQEKNQFLKSLFEMVIEPMFLLLLTATSIYFITGDYGNGIFMSAAIVLVSAISLYHNKSESKKYREIKSKI